MSNFMERNSCGLLARFGRDRSGAILPIFALSVTVALATTALAVDYGRWQGEHTTLARTADAAALSGAIALTNAQAAGHSDAAARAEAAAFNAVRVNLGYDGRPVITVTETPGAVKVSLSKPGSRMLSGMVLPQDVTISVEAEAAVGPATDACAVALGSGAGSGIVFSGSGTVTAHGCAVWSNSTSATSIDATGSGSATTGALCAAGGVDTGSYTFNPPPLANCPPAQDPLAQWTPPAVGAPCQPVNAFSGNGTFPLDPGQGAFCGGLTASGGARLIFNPGNYVIKDGPLRLSGGASIEGQGVSFLFTGAGSSIDLGGSSVVHLSAPTGGSMEGLVFAAGRNEPVLDSRIRGNAELFIEGSVYLPTHNLEFHGGPEAAVPAASTVLIARTLNFAGSSTIALGSRSPTTMPDHSAQVHVPGNVRLMR
jgi:Putative Flp pilus-assembly TadE/G-like